MKTLSLTTLILLLSLTATISQAQQTCQREVPAFMAAPGGYSISGSALLEASDSTTLYFDSAFGTQAGPDLHVYLAINFEAPSTPGNNNVDLGALVSNSGAQSYSVPAGVSLGDYAYVLIHCKSFNHWWGGGALGDISCTSATDAPGEKQSANVYPNPAEDFITIATSGIGISRIEIIDMLGRIRSTKSIAGNEAMNIDIRDLEHGVFFVVGMDERGKTILFKSLVH